jgi:protein O-GlcNAc transferase
MRHKVWAARTTSPLFDCKHYAQGLELLYSKMWERFVAGLKPDHITDTTAKK